MGDRPPEWYATIQAAKYLGIHPGQLEPGIPPKVWRERAIVAMNAESHAQEARGKRQR